MEYAYLVVIRGDVRGRRWWQLPREASAMSLGTVEPLPGQRRADILVQVLSTVRSKHPELFNTYPEYVLLEPNDVLVPMPEHAPVVTTGVIEAITEDGDLHVSTDRARTLAEANQPVLKAARGLLEQLTPPDLANDTQRFTPVVMGGEVVNSAVNVGNI